MESEHPLPVITCPFCKTVLFCDMFSEDRKDPQMDVYDYCENNNCRSRFIQLTFKNYVLGYDFCIDSFCISTRYSCPAILNIPASLNQKEGMVIRDWYGKELVRLDEPLYPEFSDVEGMRMKFKKLANFI